MSNKLFCDKCTKSRFGEVSFCSFVKTRDYINHLNMEKHKRNCEIIEKDPNSIECKCCGEKFSPEGYKVHKERNQKLWEMKKLIGNKYLTCNRFQYDKDSRRFASMDELIRNHLVSLETISNVSKKVKTKSFKESYKESKFSYRADFKDKSAQEKAEIIEKEEYIDTSIKPHLDLCEECSTHSKPRYDNDNKEYSSFHLQKWSMLECDCKLVDEDYVSSEEED
jgi:hypothetical protein